MLTNIQYYYFLYYSVVAGIPMVAVAVGLASSVETFDGNYHDCVFRFVDG